MIISLEGVSSWNILICLSSVFNVSIAFWEVSVKVNSGMFSARDSSEFDYNIYNYL